MYGMAAGCHSPVAVSGSDGNACKVTLSVRGLAKTVSSLSYIKVFCCTVPVRGSLLHGYVTAVSKSVAEDWKPSRNRYNGTYGLQVWKVAQLVEQETISSPRFDSWLSDSPKWRSSQNIFFKHPVEIWGVLLYTKEKNRGSDRVEIF